jgi:hypothetical protein
MTRLPVEYSVGVTLGYYNPRRMFKAPFGATASICRKVAAVLWKEGSLMIHVVIVWFMTPYRRAVTFGLKCNTRIALWNVRILVQSGKLEKVYREIIN